MGSGHSSALLSKAKMKDIISDFSFGREGMRKRITMSSWKRFANQKRNMVWALEGWNRGTWHCWGNGFGVLLVKKVSCGNLSFLLDMAPFLMAVIDSFCISLANARGKVSSFYLLCLPLSLASMLGWEIWLGFGRTFGGVNHPFKFLFQYFIKPIPTRMLWFRMLLSLPNKGMLGIILFIGILFEWKVICWPPSLRFLKMYSFLNLTMTEEYGL